MNNDLPTSTVMPPVPADDSPEEVARCSLTNKWFSEDALVLFRGQLVSAEGKQILLDRWQTGLDAPGKMSRSGAWRYGFGRLDCLFILPIALLLAAIAIFLLIFVRPLLALPLITHPRMTTAILFLILGFVTILYFTLSHGWRGRSVGKRAGSQRVITMDGKSVSRVRSLARAFAAYWPIFFVGVAGTVPKGSDLAWATAGVWQAVDMTCAWCDAKAQRFLHERTCGIWVIHDDV